MKRMPALPPQPPTAPLWKSPKRAPLWCSLGGLWLLLSLSGCQGGGQKPAPAPQEAIGDTLTEVLSPAAAAEEILQQRMAPLTDRQKEGLNGNVEAYLTWIYEAVEQEGVVERGNIMVDEQDDRYVYHFMVSFNQAGYYTTQMQAEQMSRYWRSTTYSYDEAGRLSKATDEQDGNISYQYDEAGRVISHRAVAADGDVRFSYTYQYNAEGSSANCYNEEGKLMAVNRYDALGRLVEEQKYTYEGSESDHVSYKYDAQGNQTAEEYRAPDNSHNYGYHRKYNAAGLLIEELRYVNKYEEADKTSYEYNAEGQLLQESYYRNGTQLYSRATYHRNEQGYCVEKELVYYDEAGAFSCQRSDQYEVDQQGNWTREVTYWTDKEGTLPKQITERKIVYFD